VFDIGGKDDRSFITPRRGEGVCKRAAKDLPIVLRDIELRDRRTPSEPAMRAFA
jgi:hypothetical protein